MNKRTVVAFLLGWLFSLLFAPSFFLGLLGVRPRQAA